MAKRRTKKLERWDVDDVELLEDIGDVQPKGEAVCTMFMDEVKSLDIDKCDYETMIRPINEIVWSQGVLEKESETEIQIKSDSVSHKMEDQCPWRQREEESETDIENYMSEMKENHETECTWEMRTKSSESETEIQIESDSVSHDECAWGQVVSEKEESEVDVENYMSEMKEDHETESTCEKIKKAGVPKLAAADHSSEYASTDTSIHYTVEPRVPFGNKVLKEFCHHGQLQFVTTLPEDFICQICMKVLSEPHATECCGQHYCKSCLEKWFRRSQLQMRGGKKVCPHCREVGFNHILYKPLQRKINDLKVFCPNVEKGCPVTVSLGDLDSHLSATNASGCDFIDVTCPNECGISYFRKDEQSHLNYQCMKRRVACKYCYTEVTYDELKDHFEDCKKYPVPCPRLCQEENLTREDLNKHEEECPNMSVKCPFFSAGCEEELTRKDLKSHVESSMAAHMMKSMTFMKSEFEKLKSSYEELKSSHGQLKANYDDLKTNYEDFKSNVSEAALEVVKAKDAVQSSGYCPNVVMPLESAIFSLTGPQLDLQNDITFCFSQKDLEVWKTSPFTVSPGYKFLVEVSYGRKEIPVPIGESYMYIMSYMTITSLFLLKGDRDNQLKWPMKIDNDIIISLYYSCGSILYLNHETFRCDQEEIINPCEKFSMQQEVMRRESRNKSIKFIKISIVRCKNSKRRSSGRVEKSASRFPIWQCKYCAAQMSYVPPQSKITICMQCGKGILNS